MASVLDWKGSEAAGAAALAIPYAVVAITDSGVEVVRAVDAASGARRLASGA